MKTTLYLVRHGQTDWNMKKKLQGWSDIPLNDTGVRQAHDLGKNLQNETIHAVYSSPLIRAHDTAKYLIPTRTHEIIVHEGLKECRFGIFEGLTWDEMVHDPRNNRSDSSDWFTHAHPGAESIADVYQRSAAVLDQVLLNHAGETVVIVAHSLPVKTMLYHAAVIAKEDIEKIHIENAYPYRLVYNDEADTIACDTTTLTYHTRT